MDRDADAPVRAQPVLEVEGLSLAVGGVHPVVEDFSLTIGRGEIVALVGESGSGKSVTALALLGLLPGSVAPVNGRVAICGEDVLDAPSSVLNRIRGNKVGIIFQQPKSMLDPTCRVGSQVGEPLRTHRGADRKTAWAQAIDLVRSVGIPDPEHRVSNYAHQLSGGMAQRVMIASALSNDPALLIADEPTTALDVTVQAQILRLLARERQERGLSILLISHDLSVVSALADRVVVMYAGRVVEQGPTAAVMKQPRHPYTTALLHCSLMRQKAGGGLYAIPGSVPQPGDDRRGCLFRTRCGAAGECGVDHLCADQAPAMHRCGNEHAVHCWAVAEADTAGHRDSPAPPAGPIDGNR